MKNASKPTLTPKLRFPEFRDGAAWDDATVEEVVDTIPPPKKLPTSLYAGNGKFPIIDQSQTAVCGWTDDSEALISSPLPLIVFGDHTCILKLIDQPFAQGADGIKILEARSEVDPRFLYHSLSHRPVATEEYKRHYAILKIRPIAFPDIQAGEQQKIAECLSTLDELIGAESQKLDALKAHKKGLMQQLFPREGEPLPRVRFPDFHSAKACEMVPLGNIAEIKLGKMLDGRKHATGRLLPYLNNISVRWSAVDTSNLPRMYFDDHELDRFGLKAGDVVVCEGGEPGRAAVWDGRLPDLKFQKALHRVRFNVPFEPHLLVQYLEAISGTSQFEKLFTGGGIKHLTRETFAKLEVPLFSAAEQHRIATCLTSLDDLIAAQSDKIAALHTHKQGLMQQLFPSPSEVDA